MSDIFPDVFEAIRILRQQKGITKKDIFIFVHERLGKACTINSVLKTMKTLNKLVDDGLLLKKGRRYMLPLPKETEKNLQESSENGKDDQNNENGMCNHGKDEDECDEDEEDDNDNDYEEEDEDEDDDDDDDEEECNLDDEKKLMDHINSKVNKDENKDMNPGGNENHCGIANGNGSKKNGEHDMMIGGFEDCGRGYGNGKYSEYPMDEDVPMRRDDNSNWESNDHVYKLRKSYINMDRYSFGRSKKTEQRSRRNRFPSDAHDKISRSRTPGRKNSDETDVMMDTEESLPESESDAQLNNSELSFECEERDELEGNFSNFRYRSPNGSPPPNTPGVHLDRKESCCSNLENATSSDKDKDGKDCEIKNNTLSKQEISLKKDIYEASLCSLCGRKKRYHDLGYDRNHGTC